MSLTYFEVASLTFGREEFTSKDFEHRVGSERAAKVLSELKKRGLAARMGRGRYRLLGPEERPDLRVGEWDRVRRIVLGAPLPKAWSGATAVEVWTHGRYRTSSSPFRREFHLAVPKSRLADWKRFLVEHGVATDGRRVIGAHVLLEARSDLGRVEDVDGEPVIPKDDVLNMIRSNPTLYGGAGDLVG